MESYGHKIAPISNIQKAILADPQTSGGLLIAVSKEYASEVISVLSANGLSDFCEPVGEMIEKREFVVYV